MCVPHDAHPPVPASAGAAIDTEELTLSAADVTATPVAPAAGVTPITCGGVVSGATEVANTTSTQ